MVDEIKLKTNSWKPIDPNNNPLKDYSHEELHYMLGTFIKPPLGTMIPKSENANLPKSFDAREGFKDCMHPVRN